MDSSYPTDENLRLIFAEGHETWLLDQLRTTKRLAVRFAIVAGFGIAWFVGVSLYVSEEQVGGPDCVRLEAGASIAQLIEQGAVPPDTTECTDDPLAYLSKPKEEGVSSATMFGLGIASLVAFTIVLAFGVETFRSLYKIRKFRTYIRDHGDFLRKYDRV